MKRQKKMAVRVCVMLFFVTLSSLFFVAREENHACTGQDCPICAMVHQAEQTIRNMGDGLNKMHSVLQMVLQTVLGMAWCGQTVLRTSLVSRKVRLND